MKIKLLIFSTLLIFLPLFAHTKPPELTPHVTRKKAEEIFKAHFKYKKFTPELARRVLGNYLEELDPAKVYLLKEEISPWTSPSEELLKRVVANFKKEDFSIFNKIYEVMVRAIERRNLLEAEIDGDELPDVSESKVQAIEWAKNKDELKKRILYLRALQIEAAENLGVGTKEQSIKKFNKRRMNREQEILQKNVTDRKKQQLTYFLKAFALALDSHSTYFTPTEANQFMVQLEQRLFGIGAKLRDDLNGFTIVHLVEGGPSMIDGRLKVGDRIIAVDHEPVVGMDILEAIDLIRGAEGTLVTLTIVREIGEGKEKKVEQLEYEMARGEIVLKEARLQSTTVPYGDGVIGHIRLFSFYQDPNHSSATDVKKAIEEIKKTHQLKGIILDLRGNMGGLLPQAVAVTGLFIKKGIVVSTKNSNGQMQHLRNFDPEIAWDGPLVVLTNKGSASAAEIVSQALQDYGRALLVGDPSTWGKGSYQICTLDCVQGKKVNPAGEYKVTCGLYYTVSGKSPQLFGAQVDIPVPGYLTETKLGETEAKFPLQGDTIEPNFQDTLSDIHPFHRGKMRRLYKQNFQERIAVYEPYLKTLKNNSKLRIEQSQNYQNFLTEMKKEVFDPQTEERYGQNDLQLEEAVCIMKDLVFLDQKGKPASAA